MMCADHIPIWRDAIGYFSHNLTFTIMYSLHNLKQWCLVSVHVHINDDYYGMVRCMRITFLRMIIEVLIWLNLRTGRWQRSLLQTPPHAGLTYRPHLLTLKGRTSCFFGLFQKNLWTNSTGQDHSADRGHCPLVPLLKNITEQTTPEQGGLKTTQLTGDSVPWSLSHHRVLPDSSSGRQILCQWDWSMRSLPSSGEDNTRGWPPLTTGWNFQDPLSHHQHLLQPEGDVWSWPSRPGNILFLISSPRGGHAPLPVPPALIQEDGRQSSSMEAAWPSLQHMLICYG